MSLQAQEGEFVIEGICILTREYVLGGVAVPRPPNPAVLSGMTLRNCPVGSTIWIGRTNYTVDDPTVELSFQFHGTYLVRVESFPELDASFTVEAK